MNSTFIYALYGGLAGVLGTGFGGLISLFIGKKGNKFKSCLLEFSSGLMLCVIFLDLLPNALKLASILNIIIGILLGIMLMNITDSIVKSNKNNSLFHTGIILSVGIAMHNFPEGLAIGSSYNVDTSLFLSLTLSIFAHDIPEGILLGIPLKLSGIRNIKVFIISILTGFFTLLGTFCGILITNTSIIGSTLAIASGAMLYIVFFEIIPQAKQLHFGRISSFSNILGIITGVLLSNILN